MRKKKACKKRSNKSTSVQTKTYRRPVKKKG